MDPVGNVVPLQAPVPVLGVANERATTNVLTFRKT